MAVDGRAASSFETGDASADHGHPAWAPEPGEGGNHSLPVAGLTTQIGLCAQVVDASLVTGDAGTNPFAVQCLVGPIGISVQSAADADQIRLAGLKD